MFSLTFICLLVLSVFAVAQDADPVRVSLYYESLCPYCQDFITGSTYKAWNAEGVAEIMTFEYYPYGNAHETYNGTAYTFSCQHGDDECVGNIIETCAINILGDQFVWYPFIYCMENSRDVTTAGPKCAEELGIDYTPIEDCANSTQGNELEHEMAEATDSLNPAHTYVPWILINGVHTEDQQSAAQRSLLAVVCKTYTGTKPAGCTVQEGSVSPVFHTPTKISVN